ncbi:hypothetical protein K435DRAFT_27471 [Dendrothele bispora CBS 962.96]|uniref:Uncharacterized protein n=1 Tax=Dendrothele bispora (strain CBS 962.96) TaxID=1314807 RepID=A0A4V4HBG5_DENBC|nr:hypothetical protein K435DRAFT_27471 [Dendrothele bispora CBS 962.96]
MLVTYRVKYSHQSLEIAIQSELSEKELPMRNRPRRRHNANFHLWMNVHIGSAFYLTESFIRIARHVLLLIRPNNLARKVVPQLALPTLLHPPQHFCFHYSVSCLLTRVKVIWLSGSRFIPNDKAIELIVFLSRYHP